MARESMGDSSVSRRKYDTDRLTITTDYEKLQVWVPNPWESVTFH